MSSLFGNDHDMRRRLLPATCSRAVPPGTGAGAPPGVASMRMRVPVEVVTSSEARRSGEIDAVQRPETAKLLSLRG